MGLQMPLFRLTLTLWTLWSLNKRAGVFCHSTLFMTRQPVTWWLVMENFGRVVKRWALSHDDPGSILNPGSFETIGQFFVHSTLPQFTQLYKWVPGYRQWWIMWTNSLPRSNCCEAQCFPEKLNLRLYEQVCEGSYCECLEPSSWLDTAR